MRRIIQTVWRILTAPFRIIYWFFRLIYRWFANIAIEIRTFMGEEPEDEPLAETVAKTIQNPGGLLVHIDALRKHLLRALAFLALTTALSFTFTSKIIDVLSQPVGGIGALRAIDVTEPIGVFMRVALLAGFALGLPYIAFELWLFAAPGLKRNSRIISLVAIPVTTFFFIGGMLFAYTILLPNAIPFLVNFMGITAQLRPSSYVRFVTGIMFWIGIAFEFPLVVFLLARIGLVKARSLLDQWRLAVVAIALLSAMITPTVDPVNMALVMGPMVTLYFLGVGLAWLAARNR